MPTKSRTDMLITGIRTPLGVKVLGSDLTQIQQVGIQIETALKGVPATTRISAEQTSGGFSPLLATASFASRTQSPMCAGDVDVDVVAEPAVFVANHSRAGAHVHVCDLVE